MKYNPLFRKAALDNLESPERLDAPTLIVPPMGWAALSAIGVLLVCIVSWAVLGTMAERVDGRGILIRGGELRSIVATGSGQLSRLNVRLDDVVNPGDVVGEIEQVDVADRVHVAQRRHEETQLETQQANTADQQTIDGYQANISANEQDIERTQVMWRSQAESLERLQRLLQAGGVTQARVEQVRIAMNDLRSRMDSLDAANRAISAQIRSVDERMRARQQQVRSALLNLQTEKHRLNTTSKITAAVQGRIVDIKKHPGDRLVDGEVLAIVEPRSSLLEPVVFVPSGSGKRIEQGMEVRIYPSTVKREVYGFMKGTVKATMDFPVTPETLASIVNNSQLVEEFLAGGSKIETRIALQPDPQTTSGYAWSFGGGPPFKVDGGTTVAVAIVVARHSPISKVWPTVKGLLGGQ